MPRVGIIGSAGRNGLMRRVTPAVYARMKAEARAAIDVILKEHPDDAPLCLLSGGAAVSDHIAVFLYLERKTFWPSREVTLELFLPAPFELRQGVMAYAETQCGRRSNELHVAFSRAARLDSLADLGSAITAGAIAKAHKSFSERNRALAEQVEYLIAFGFEFKDTFLVTPGEVSTYTPSGGTGETWNSARNHATLLYVPIK